MKRVFCLYPLVLLFALSCAKGGEKVTLQYKFDPGKPYLMEVCSFTESTFDKTTVTSEMIMTFRQEAVGGDEEGTEVKFTIERIAMDMLGIKLDTDKEDEIPENFDFLTAFKNKYFTMSFTSDGKVQSVGGFEEFFAQVDSSRPESERNSPIFEGYKSMFSEEKMKELVGRGMNFMPKVPVAVGDKWTREISFDMPGAGKIEADVDMELKAIENGEAVIQQDFVMEIEREQSDSEVQLNFDQMTGSGSIRFLIHEGVCKSNTVQMKSKISSEMNGQSQEVEVKAKFVVKLSPVQ